jgi:alkylation response protein AidB-like acyl-CoA dehydrogenase
MANYFSKRNLDFLVFEVHKATDLTQYSYFEAHDRQTLAMALDSAIQLADTAFPNLRATDKSEPQLVNGQVKVHPRIKEFLQASGDAGLIGASFSFENGGQQLPELVNSCITFLFMAANNGMIYSGLSNGAANLIVSFGKKELHDLFVPKMLAGRWQGTMALTEPQAGSSLSDITTSAVPNADGTYKIAGQKIFISAGDHDGAENIVHLVLARIQGAPKGTKGISLFVVPKLLPKDGELLDNDVASTGLYHKMGQRGTPALHLTFGENDNCTGWLIGEPNQGLGYMFKMMNEARIGVGMTGAAIASAAYYASLQYANERPQSRRLNEKNQLDTPQVAIIQHPDVRRMLLTQKAIVEGSLSLLLECARYADLAHVSEGDEKEKYGLLLDLLTPVAKAYPTEAGIRSVSEAMQVLGGYGYTEDFPIEQLYRDIRITSIYEGTTTIQAQDLLGRKVTIKGGKAPMLLFKEIEGTLKAASQHENLLPYCEQLKNELLQLKQVTESLMAYAQQGDIEQYLMDATLYMELFGLVVVAWQWLKQGTEAQKKLTEEQPTGDEQLFYESKLHTLKFFFHYEVIKTRGLAARLTSAEALTITGEKDLII